jgi:ankyrin repeat protein
MKILYPTFLALLIFILGMGVDIRSSHALDVTKRLMTALHEKDIDRSIELLESTQNCTYKYLGKNSVQIDAKDKEENTLLILAAEIKSPSLFNFLLKLGAPISEKNNKGNTALIQAARAGHLEIVQELVKAGASVDEPSKKGNTALILAAEGGHLEVVKYLLDQGATLEHETEKKNTALLLASENGHIETVKELIARGANKTQQSWKGHTPLTLAAMNGHTELTRLFLNEGLKVNHQIASGQTALFLAIERQKHEVVKLLLQNGASTSVLDQRRLTPLLVAILNRDLISLRILLEFGADATYITPEGVCSISAAHESKDVLLIEVLTCFKALHDSSTLENTLEVKAQIHAKLELLKTIELNFDYLPLWSILKELAHSKATSLYIQQKEAEMSKIHLLKKVCSVCTDKFEVSQSELKGPAECECYICPDCLPSFVEHELIQNKNNLSLCPGCRGIVRNEYLKRLNLPEEEVTRISLKQIEHKLCSLPNFVFCRTPNCPGGKVVEPNESGYYNCALCDWKGCLLCKKDHRGTCDQSNEEDKKTYQWMQHLLEQGKLPAPKKGHSKDPEHPNYYQGRFRPCYYCGLITEKEFDGTQHSGQCNSMVCAKCKRSWHWNYGDHRKHPKIGESEAMHDFNGEKQQYEPLQTPHYY